MSTTKKATRVNEYSNNAAYVAPSRGKAKPHLTGGVVINPILDGQALAPQLNIWDRGTYRLGDGDVVTPLRPGSMAAYALPSRGIGK
jgi:hypothetical protein